MKKMKKFHLLLAVLLFTLLIPVCKPTTIQAATLKAPKTLTVKQGRNNISVQWSKVSGAKGYVVYRKTSPSQGWKRLKVVKAPTVKYLDKNISSGKNYYYTVRPYTTKSGKNSYGSYNKSGRNTIYLKEPKVTATKSHKSVTLKWNKITGASGYEVYRKSGNSGYSKVKTTTALSYKDTAVEPNTKYTYAVRAYKKSGSSVFRSLYYDGANLVSVKTQAVVEDPVVPDPVAPDINDAVESKVYFNEYGGIIELYNKSESDYNFVVYEIDFYNKAGELIWRVPESTISMNLYSKMTDYSSFTLPKNLEYSHYKMTLGATIPSGKVPKYVNIGNVFTKNDVSYTKITNISAKVIDVSFKVLLLHNGNPLQMIQGGHVRLNIDESKEIDLPYRITNDSYEIKVIPRYIFAS